MVFAALSNWKDSLTTLGLVWRFPPPKLPCTSILDAVSKSIGSPRQLLVLGVIAAGCARESLTPISVASPPASAFILGFQGDVEPAPMP